MHVGDPQNFITLKRRPSEMTIIKLTQGTLDANCGMATTQHERKKKPKENEKERNETKTELDTLAIKKIICLHDVVVVVVVVHLQHWRVVVVATICHIENETYVSRLEEKSGLLDISIAIAHEGLRQP